MIEFEFHLKHFLKLCKSKKKGFQNINLENLIKNRGKWTKNENMT